MAETLCQKRALEAFNLDPAKWGGICIDHMIIAKFKKCGARYCVSIVMNFSSLLSGFSC